MRRKAKTEDLNAIANAIRGSSVRANELGEERPKAHELATADRDHRRATKKGKYDSRTFGAKMAMDEARGIKDTNLAPEAPKRGRGRPKSQATIDAEAKRAKEIKEGRRVAGKRGRAKSAEPKKEKPKAEPKKRGRKPSEKTIAVREKKAKLQEAGIELKGRGRLPSLEKAQREPRKKKNQAVVMGKLPRKIEPSDIKGDIKAITGYRGKTHIEVRKLGGSVVKLMTRTGSDNKGKSYEVTRNLVSRPGTTSFTPNSVHVLVRSKGVSVMKMRRHNPDNRALSETQGSVTKSRGAPSKQGTKQSFKPGRKAPDYGNPEFWHGLRAGGGPAIDVSEPGPGRTTSSVARLTKGQQAKLLTKQQIHKKHLVGGRGKAHKGGRYR